MEDMKMKTKLLIIAALLVGVVGGFILAQNFVTGNAQKGNIGADEAKSIALKNFNGEITEFEYDNSGSKPHYEFEIVQKDESVDLEVDAKTGEIIIKERKAINSNQNGTNNPKQATTNNTNNSKQEKTTSSNSLTKSSTKTNTNSTAKNIISSDKAISIAITEVGGGTVTEVELDKKNGYSIYEVEVKNGNVKYDFDIDAVTGEVLKKERKTISNNKQNNTTSNSTSNQANDTKNLLSENKAAAIALDKAGGGNVTSVELDRDNGIYIYEIKVKNGNVKYEFDINAKTGAIIKEEQKKLSNNKQNETKTNTTTTKKPKEETKGTSNNSSSQNLISKDKAKSIALGKTGGGTITDFELDKEHGKYVYEIEIRNGNVEYDLDIDAKTGKIIKFEKEIEDYDD